MEREAARSAVLVIGVFLLGGARRASDRAEGHGRMWEGPGRREERRRGSEGIDQSESDSAAVGVSVRETGERRGARGRQVKGNAQRNEAYSPHAE